MQIAVIPAYNEAKNIAFVLKNLQSCNLQQLILWLMAVQIVRK